MTLKKTANVRENRSAIKFDSLAGGMYIKFEFADVSQQLC